MTFCVLAFVGIYAAVLGIAAMLLNIWWPISLFGMNATISLLCFGAGVLLSFIVLGFIRMMGELSGDEDPDVIYHTTRITAFLGLLATVAAAAIQSYFRMTYGIKNFLLHKGAWLQDILEFPSATTDGMLFFLVLALPLLIGIPIFIFTFYAQSFDEYVTVHYVEMGGEDVETSRSDTYLPIWPTLVIGLLLSAALIFLALTPLVYLLIVPFAILLFGYPNKKRIITASVISGILAVVAVILSFALSTGSTFGTEATEGLVYSDTVIGYYVSGYTGNDTEVVIPKRHENLPVIGIAEAAFADTAITSVTIPATVKTIEARAFENCTALTSVKLPTALTGIGASAFSGCVALNDITIPESVTAIGSTAFLGCDFLIIRAEAEREPSGWSYDFAGDAPVVWNYPKNDIAEDGYIHTYVNSIHYMLQSGEAVVGTQNPKNIDNLTFPASVTYGGRSYPVVGIADRAFDGNTALSALTIPESVKSIGADAFKNCAALSALTIPASVKSIGEAAFSGCSSLTALTFAENSRCEAIGASAFKNCTALSALTIPASVKTIGGAAFSGCRSLGTLIFAENSGCEAIGAGAFSECAALSEITIPASVTTIGHDPFGGCDLTLIRCEIASRPSGWKNWNSQNAPILWDCNHNDVASNGYIYTQQDGLLFALKNGTATVAKQKKNITAANIPASISYKGTDFPVTRIGYEAFSHCTALQSVTVPSSVTYIENSAFLGCTALQSVTISSSVSGFGIGAFEGCTSLQSITIPAGATAINKDTFNGCTSLTEITIPASVTSIGEHAFSDCTSLTRVTFASDSRLEYIREQAFLNCSALTSIKLPSTVTTIEWQAFSGCSALTSIRIPASVTTVGAAAFITKSTSMLIYCEAAIKPSGWHNEWNYSNFPVIWGYGTIK